MVALVILLELLERVGLVERMHVSTLHIFDEGLYFFPKSLAGTAAERGSLHAKCVIVDRRVTFMTSANFTEAAQNRNIEVGVLTRFTPMVQRLAAYFDGLIESGVLERVHLE